MLLLLHEKINSNVGWRGGLTLVASAWAQKACPRYRALIISSGDTINAGRIFLISVQIL